MIIDFKTIEEKGTLNFKGGEGTSYARTYQDDLGKIICTTLKKGTSIGYHLHETSSETMYIISGIANFVFDGKEEVAYPGEVHYCPKGSSHSIRNDHDEDLVMFCVVPLQ